jgi:MFS family permease
MSMVLSTAAAGILKTLFVTTNNIIATQYNVSYMAAAALTGVPFMVAAMVSLGSATLSQAIGKRTVNLGGTLLMLSAAAWNMQITQSYLQFMSSRVLQGVGWGALEGIVMLSVRDIFFVCPPVFLI